MRTHATQWLIVLLLAASLVRAQEANVPEVLVLDNMEKDVAKNWSGGAPDGQHVKSGATSVRWADHLKATRLVAKHLPKDWTRYNALEFWMFSAVANGADTILILSSENPATEGPDYWSYPIKVDWTAWKHFRIPLKSLGQGARKPIGWHDLQSVCFTCSGWNCTPKPDTALWLDDLLLTREPVKLQVKAVARGEKNGEYRCSIGIRSLATQEREFALSVALSDGAKAGATVEGAPTIHLSPSEEKVAVVNVVMASSDPGRDILTVVARTTGDPELRAELSVPVARLCFQALQPPPHPRLYVTPTTLDALRRRVQDDPVAKEAWSRIKKRADALADEYLAKGIPDKLKKDIDSGRDLYAQATTLAFAYLMTTDKRYAEASRQVMLATFQWNPWVFEFHRPIPADLGTGMICQAFGTAYDWIYDALTPEQRAELRAGIMKRGMGPWWDYLSHGAWWGKCVRCNWLAVCCGGGAVCAMSFLGEEPDAAEWIADAHWRIVSFLDEGGVDGGWPEGVGYWSYGMTYAALYGAALQTVTNGEMNLFKHRYLQVTAQFPLYMVFPPNGCANFADCGYHLPSSSLIAKLAAESQNPYAQWHVERYPPGDLYGILWHDPSFKAKPPTDLPQSIHFRGIDWAVFRSGWDGNETAFAMRGGNNGENHGMLECSDFVINSRGERLIVNMGAPKYSHEYFSKDRWTFYRANSHGQNEVVIDDKDQLAGREREGKISGFVTTPIYDYLKCDLTGAWEGLAKRVARHVAFIKPDCFLMFDDVRCDQDRSFDWRAHTVSDPLVAGARAGAVAKKATLEMQFLHPASLQLTAERHEMGEPYLLARMPGKASQAQFLTLIETREAPTASTRPSPAAAPPNGIQAPPRVLLIMGDESEEWKRIADLLESEGLICIHAGESDLAQAPPVDRAELQSYATIFLAPFKGGARAFTKEQIDAFAEYVANGGGLFVVGGAETFGEGGFDKTAIAPLLPITILSDKDNIKNVTQRPSVVADHEILQGLPKEWPTFGSAFGGYTKCALREGATMLLAAQREVAGADVPFVAIREHGQGRVMVFGTMWAFGTGKEFKEWPHAARFLGQSVSWLSKAPQQDVRCWLRGGAGSGLSGALSLCIVARNERQEAQPGRIVTVTDTKGKELARVKFDTIAPLAERTQRVTVDVPDGVCEDGLLVLSTTGATPTAYPVHIPRSSVRAEKIAGDGWLGAKVTEDGKAWTVLFNLRTEPMSAEDIQADAEAASICRAETRVRFLAMHGGKRLAMAGQPLIEGASPFSCALDLGEKKIAGQVQMADAGTVSLRIADSPEKVSIRGNGMVETGEWNRETRTATVRLEKGANNILVEW